MSIKTKLTEIANAIRYTLGTETKYSLAQMPPLIRSLNSNLKTGDIYYNLFKFDCSKYNDSMIFNQNFYFRNYPEPYTFKENIIIGKIEGYKDIIEAANCPCGALSLCICSAMRNCSITYFNLSFPIIALLNVAIY